jgi:hypothetical protein
MTIPQTGSLTFISHLARPVESRGVHEVRGDPDSGDGILGEGPTLANEVPPGRRVAQRARSALLSDRWPGLVPSIIAAWLAVDFALWIFFAIIGVSHAWGVVLYLAAWVGFLSLLIHAVDRFRPRGLAAHEYLILVGVAALIEEAAAYFVGGGLAGRATSLREDWAVAVPVFLGMAAAVLVARPYLGAEPGRTMVAAAFVGSSFEMLGNVSQPLYVALLGGTAAWTYGGMLGLPLRPPTDQSELGGAPKSLAGRFAMEAVLLLVGLVLGGFVGVSIGSNLS